MAVATVFVSVFYSDKRKKGNHISVPPRLLGMLLIHETLAFRNVWLKAKVGGRLVKDGAFLAEGTRAGVMLP
jgi:hypothetical protein